MKKLALLLACLASAAEAAVYQGLTLEQALADLRARGLPLYYSSDLVKPWMRVEREPASTGPRGQLDEILAPHGILAAEGPDGALLLVRPVQRAPRHAAPGATHRPAPAPLDAVVVSASHYLFGDEAPQSPAVFGAAELGLLPEIGEDPLRAVSRLPGVARQDFSSRFHVRGGDADETLVRYDDVRLYKPFHFKDFLGVFSTIDPGIVSDIRVYTGGFPVNFGDRSSGVVDIAPRLPQRQFHGQAVLSLLTAGIALDGSFSDGAGDWAVAARRGNMDLFLDLADSNLGEPDYHDLYAHAGRRINDLLAISANALVSDDRLRAFDSDREEEARADYQDQYYWLRFDLGAPDRAGGRVLATHTRLASERSGSAALPGVTSGSLDDRRSFRIHSLQADGWWHAGARSLLQLGAEWRQLSGRYRYADDVDFEVLFLTPGAATTASRSRSIALRPSGHQAAAYLNWRLEPAVEWTTDLGLRWDRDTLAARDGSHFSPRVVLLWQPDVDSRLRLSWGRFFQAQGIDELQMSDGERSYSPAQRATHKVASIEHDLTPALMLRAELYRKDYARPLPRHENLLNTLIVLPELQPDRIRIAPRSARAEGAEATLSYDDGRFSGWLNFSWARVFDRVDGERLRRSWDQRHYASGGLSLRGERWEAAIAATWHGGWPTTAIELLTLEPFPLASVGRRNAERLPDYARIDLRVARRFDLAAAGELTVFAEINNVVDRGNVCCVEYEIEDEDGDGVAIFDVNTTRSLPIVPSLGFDWQF